MKLRILGFTGCLALAGTMLAAGAPDTRGLLKELRSEAADTADHAFRLKNVSRYNGASWFTQAGELSALKVHVNEMGRVLSQLEERRNAATPEEQNAIDEAAVLLKAMADSTQAAIIILSKAPESAWQRPFQNRVKELASETQRLSERVNLAVRNEKAL